MENLIKVAGNAKNKKEWIVLNYLQKNGAKSRVDLSHDLNITKAAITELTNEMLKARKIVEKGEKIGVAERHSRGRRKILMDINENYKLTFGIVIRKSEIIVGLTNLKGQILGKLKARFEPDNYRDLLEVIVKSIKRIMRDNCIVNENVLGIGITLSESGGNVIDGEKTVDKLHKIRKDLSHAISMKIVVTDLMSGSLIAQSLFGKDQFSSCLLLRYDDTADSAVMINDSLYKGYNGRAGGFQQITAAGQNEHLQNEEIALIIQNCCNVLDPQKIYCFGSRFEEEDTIQKINEKLLQLGGAERRIELAVFTNETSFLSPCAVCINCNFYAN